MVKFIMLTDVRSVKNLFRIDWMVSCLVLINAILLGLDILNVSYLSRWHLQFGLINQVKNLLLFRISKWHLYLKWFRLRKAFFALYCFLCLFVKMGRRVLPLFVIFHPFQITFYIERLLLTSAGLKLGSSD